MRAQDYQHGSTQAESFRGRAMLILCAILWSCSGLFATAPILDDWPTDVRGPLIAFWRALFAGLFLLPCARSRSWSWKLVPASCTFAAMNVTYLTAMAKTTAANAIWLQSTSPIWVFLFAYFVLRQPVHRLDWLMLLLGGLGVSVILVFELRSARSGASMQGACWGVLSGVTFAGVILALRSLRNVDSIWLVSILLLFTACALFPFVISCDTWPSYGQLAWLATFGIVQMGIPYVLFAGALRTVPSHEAAFLILLEPILVPVWVWLAWRNHATYQPLAPWTLVGATLILAGLVLRFGGEAYARSTSNFSGRNSSSS
jgi:drug/metabolite transporter (DMT)-like permease